MSKQSMNTLAAMAALGLMSGISREELREDVDEIVKELSRKDPTDPIQAEKIRKAEEKRERKAMKRPRTLEEIWDSLPTIKCVPAEQVWPKRKPDEQVETVLVLPETDPEPAPINGDNRNPGEETLSCPVLEGVQAPQEK